MIDFIYKLHSILPNWPNGSQLTLGQISDATGTEIPHVLHYLGEGLCKEIDVIDTFTQEDASCAVDLLSKKMRPQIEARERVLAEKREKAAKAYDRMMGKVRVYLAANNSHSAYKTLVYFAGQFEQNLPEEILITTASDAVRVGIKAGINIQELGRWLQKAVSVAMKTQTRDGIEEALDLVDAYGEYFLSEDTGKGPLLLGNILAALEEPSARYELWEQYKTLVGQLYP
jgi:hypothetical protein